MIFKTIFSNFFLKAEKFFVNLSFILFLVFLFIAILQELDNLLDYFVASGLITLVLNIVVFIVAFFLCRLFNIKKAQKKTILIETGLQNGTLAIVVTGLIFNDPIYLVPTATYALIMYGIIFLYIIGLKFKINYLE
jgi:BASS family bile acid:Na+ symporter